MCVRKNNFHVSCTWYKSLLLSLFDFKKKFSKSDDSWHRKIQDRFVTYLFAFLKNGLTHIKVCESKWLWGVQVLMNLMISLWMQKWNDLWLHLCDVMSQVWGLFKDQSDKVVMCYQRVRIKCSFRRFGSMFCLSLISLTSGYIDALSF